MFVTGIIRKNEKEKFNVVDLFSFLGGSLCVIIMIIFPACVKLKMKNNLCQKISILLFGILFTLFGILSTYNDCVRFGKAW